MERIAAIVKREGLLQSEQRELDIQKGAPPLYLEEGGAKLYKRSLYARNGALYFIAKLDGVKSLFVASEKAVKGGFTGAAARFDGIHLLKADFSLENARVLRELFPFTAPISLRDKKTTIGCGDRLGLATPGHLRAANKFDCYPVLAQQSVRELTLTKRDFQSVARDVSFLVFQEGYERGYGSDGDHLKKMADIDLALEAGMPMITLDLTEVMHPDPASWSTAKIDSEFEKLDDSIAQPVLRMYAGKTFKLSSSTIVFGAEEVKRCTLMYWDMLEFTKQVDSHLKDKRGDQYDLEISIDETTTPTVPSHHLFIASELQNRGVVVNSLAPRFIGEFQKGIDYIGKVEEFDKQFMVHCDIARAYGNYKVSIHSGSDKFSVYPSIGKYTRERLHLKTAGTSWLEAMRVVARTNPALFRRMLAKAFDYFPEATKLYHITADIHQIRDAREVDDAHLDEYLNDSNSRQLIHITYGGLLNDPDLRSEFFRTLDEHEEEHYATIERHLTKHIELLGVERRQ